MTVGEIIGEGLDIHFDFSSEEKIEKISNVMKDVGLDDSLDRFLSIHMNSQVAKDKESQLLDQ